jgi:outer membrane biosynthesis protein TonB
MRQSAPSPTPTPAPAPTPSPQPAPTPAPAPAPAPLPPAPTPPTPPAAAPIPAAAPAPEPARQARPAPENAPTPEPVARAADQEFASQADEGWRAASAVVAEQPDEVTAAGLPKRRPRARLVPGSAGSAVLAPPVSSARSAETVRGRLASYQHGVRQGRESRMRGAADPGSGANAGSNSANAGVNHDEESS